MQTIRVDLSESVGKIKPMNAVNNGPTKKSMGGQVSTDYPAYADARIPYMRTHDSSYFAGYGGEHTVDVKAIFPDFDADPEDPASYDFLLTDEYLLETLSAGTQIFYRLGHRIEHESKKYGTLPPPDFRKWAVICEHIIRHLNEGWANGHHMNIRYWEIWNEPDLDPDDAADKRTWGGTKAQFFDLFEITAKHLKACFPDLMIGGPAVARAHDGGWCPDFLTEMKRRGVPMDFFSWHCYTTEPTDLLRRAREVRRMLDRVGYPEAESILDEWNYIRDWKNGFRYSLNAIVGLKGAAFGAAAMELLQYEPVDLLMYYDARPCEYNGLFDWLDRAFCLKGYYPFWAFSRLASLGNAARVETEGDSVFAVAACDGREGALMLTYYNEDDTTPAREVVVEIQLPRAGKYRVEYRLLDAAHDLEEVREENFTAARTSLRLRLCMNLFDSYYIRVIPAEEG